jgi:hypothetical protein
MNSLLDKGVVTLNNIPNFKPQGMMYGGEPSKVLSEPPPLSMSNGGNIGGFQTLDYRKINDQEITPFVKEFPFQMNRGNETIIKEVNPIPQSGNVPEILQATGSGVMSLPLSVQRPISFGGVTSLAGGGQPGYGLMGLMNNTYEGMI